MRISIKHLGMLLISLVLTGNSVVAQVANNVIDEVIWVVGDEAILKSDVEGMRLDPEWSQIKGNPYCVIPERLAIQKLFLHQAAIDSIEVGEAQVNSSVEQRIEYMAMMAGGKEKLEEYMNMPMSQIREELFDRYKDELTVKQMKDKLTEDVKVNPAEVRRYFKDLSEDSLPLIPTQVEVEILVQSPRIPQEEIDRVKDELRGYAERVTNGTSSFSTLSILYSEDKESARQGGDLGSYLGRNQLDPAFATVAFSLTDPKKVSKVVESEYGYHIIQLIDKRGDKIRVRHILRTPRIADEDIKAGLSRLDSIADDIRKEKFSFEEAASVLSDDKNSRANHGLIYNSKETEDEQYRTSLFEMKELSNMSSDLARVVDGLEIGEISKPFTMINDHNKQVCAIVKLKNRIKEHRANIQEDFQVLKGIVLNKKKEEVLNNWIKEKQKSTYVRINEGWRDCDFEYPGWIK